MKKLVALIALLALVLWWFSRPEVLTALPQYTPSASKGEAVFWAGGCASCHATPVDGRRAKGEAKRLLGGGLALETDFGVFHVPNISSDPQHGIGDWSALQFVTAMQLGTSPDRSHYYPSFPYASYTRMAVEDILDLKAYLDTLPAVSTINRDHEMKFPWSISRGIGIWKRMFVTQEPFVSINTADPILVRGQDLVEGVGHCGECHTPRNAFGAMDATQWLSGAPNPDGAGVIPDITPNSKSIGDWSEGDLVYYFETGLTPDFDTVGGSMVAVQENLAELSADDRRAIAAYLKAL